MKRLTLGLILTLAALPAAAGVVFEMEHVDLSQPKAAPSLTRMQLDGDNMKVDIDREQGSHDGEVIFLGAKREMLIVNHGDKSYMTMDEEQMKAIAEQVNQAMASMEQALANLPPAQREQMQQMMAGQMPDMGEKREPCELKKTGGRKTVNGYPCEHYEVWRSGVREREMWVTPWSKLDGGNDVRTVFETLAEFSRTLLDSMPMAADQGMTDPSLEHMDEIGGFPVKTVEYATDGSATSETTFKGTQKVSLSAADFAAPEGYKHRDLTQQMRR